ncbi:ABC transporter permease [Corynebacterium flavescens]|uniref:Iron ABC transporter permease n=1 Tax=Corynebacterium flavescens TaxID=28028 RepID=A0A1L7CKJ7_CORFL|nr:iron chelate uptake ABC transporter family permease subunit [Corynebacterium flavescens]APT86394.1 iron ABC transporter permease [Corynebacterium flavescens]KAA8723874.1 iron chelate uptake ABC transporter family permease subunit [Corynebacterium flavescens]GEB97515.1 iron ABC transporter permease [Corynebacterium flavescens]
MKETTSTPTRTPTRARLFDWKLLLGIAGVIALMAISLMVGEYDIFGHDDGAEMFNTTRVPRTIALMLAGAAMAMSGLVMQLLTQNRFVEPTTTGTTEWAGLGLLVSLVFLPQSSILGRMIVAVIFSFVGTMVFFAFLRRVKLRSSLIVPIIGIMLGSVVSAVSSYFALATDMLQQLGIWFMGSFTSVYEGQYEVLWVVVVVLVAVFYFADKLTVAGLGEDIATNVGLNYNRLILIGTGLIAVATGVVTVVVGALPFLGLIVPNVVSMFRGDDLRSNLPWVCLLGIATVTVCDLIGRTIIAPFEMPVSVILGVIGAVVFVSLIVRSTRERK